MTYSELIEKKQAIAIERAKLDAQEAELDKKLSKAKKNQAEKLLEEICEKIHEIANLGYHVVGTDFNNWIEQDSLYSKQMMMTL